MDSLKDRLDKIAYIREHVMAKNVHYGPPYASSKKEVLLKPGAELLGAFFGLRPEFVERSIREEWNPDKPLFFYRYDCHLYDIFSGLKVGGGIGSCNSMEAKYRWRDNKRTCPQCNQPTILKSKFEDRKTHDLGWYCNEKGGGCGANFHSTDKRITDQEVGRVPNDDVFSVVNTVDTQAQKRAFLGAMLMTTGASFMFTQDVEDFKGHEYFFDVDSADERNQDIPAWILMPDEMIAFGEFLKPHNFKVDELSKKPGLNLLDYSTRELAQEAVLKSFVDTTTPPPSKTTPPPPTKTTPPPPPEHWMNKGAQAADDWLTEKKLKRPDVKRLTGKPIADYPNLEAMKNAVLKALPPTRQDDGKKAPPEENKNVWSSDKKLGAGRWVSDNFDQSDSWMLDKLHKKEWTDFSTPADVAPAVIAVAKAQQFPVVAHSLTYKATGNKKLVVFHTTLGDFTLFGGREALTSKLGFDGLAFAEAYAIESWELASDHKLDKQPIKVAWEAGEKGPKVIGLTLVKQEDVDFMHEEPAAEQEPELSPA